MDMPALNIPVLPDMKRFAPNLAKAAGRAALSAGKAAGRNFSEGFKKAQSDAGSAALRAGSVAGDKFVSGFKKAGPALAKHASGMVKQAGGKISGGLDKGLKSIPQLLGKVLTGGLKAAAVGVTAAAVAIGAAVGVGLKKSVDLASGFESSMRQVGVATKASGKDLQDLTKYALDMGAKTSFSAQGASDAMLALAKGGMTRAQIKAGGLAETLTLASAGSLELGEAADFVVQGLGAFGLKAEEAGRVSAALAGGANASTASVQSMGQALAQVGASARQNGLSIEDTTAALAAFANNGIQGSDAGTSLKTALARLQPTTKGAYMAMQELGLITKEGRNQFFTAKGEMKSMTEVAGLLQTSLKGQTKQQKAATLQTIFGSDASRAASILATEGAAGLAKYVKATNDKKAAENLAKSATQGYAGALERFKGSMETAGIVLGTKLLPKVGKLLDYFSSKAFGGGLVKAAQDIAPALSVLADAGGSMLSVAKTAVSSFASELGGGSKNHVKTFAQFVQTNQAKIVRGFTGMVIGALDFGIKVGQVVSTGLNLFATLSDTLDEEKLHWIRFAQTVLDASIYMLGWVPGLGDKLRNARGEFEGFAISATKDMYKTGDKARGAASQVDKITAAAQGAKVKAQQFANTEITKAAQKDAANKTALAVESIGKKGDFARLKLKGFNIESGTGTKGQQAFAGKVFASRMALVDQYDAAKTAKVGHDGLNKILKIGEKRLYDEFIQMNISSEEAKKLAKKYSQVPTKRETDFAAKTATAKEDAKNYHKFLASQKKKYTTTQELKYDTKVDGTDTRLVLNARSSGGGRNTAGGLTTFDVGGYTGNMPAKRVAGVVHGDEQVIKSKSRRKFESNHPGTLDHINITGKLPEEYFNGGRVTGFHDARRAGSNAVDKKMEPRIRKMLQAAQAQMAGDLGGSAASPNGIGRLGPRAAAARQMVIDKWGITNIGGYANRNIAGTNVKSKHALGKAIDIMTYTRHPEIANYFVGNAQRLGTDNVITQRRIWNQKGWHGYNGIPHMNHVHVDFYKDGGRVGMPDGRGPGLATGGTALKEGWARVGERGPETIHMPKGGRVEPNGSGRPIVINIDLGDGVTRRVEQVLDDRDSYNISLSRMGGR